VKVYEGAQPNYNDVVPYSVSSVVYRVRAKNSVGLLSDWAFGDAVSTSAAPPMDVPSQVANNRYFVEKCNHLLGTTFKVPASERVINVEWLLKTVNIVYTIIHVKGECLKEPYDYHTQLLAPNLHSNQSKQVVNKTLVDDVLKYMIQFKGVCTCDVECGGGSYGVCKATCSHECVCTNNKLSGSLFGHDCANQCIGPTCRTDPVTGKQVPKNECENCTGNPQEQITYCQTTCSICDANGKVIQGNCGHNSNDASTCPYNQGNNGTVPGNGGGNIGTGGNQNDRDCNCNCECSGGACAACGGACGSGSCDQGAPERNCLNFCGMPINCDVEYRTQEELSSTTEIDG
jgi:hypothetical protein